MKKNIKQKLKQNFIYLILILILGVAFSYFSFFSEFFYDLVDFFKKYADKNSVLSQVLFVFISALTAMLMPLSSAPLVPGAVVIWGSGKTFYLLLSGWMIGHSLSYLLARFALHPVAKVLVDFKKINYYKEQLSDKLEFTLILLFCFASPAEILGYVLGMLRYSFFRYFFAVLISEIPFALLSVYASEAFLANDMVLLVGFIAAGLGIGVIMFYFLNKKLKKIIVKD